MPGDQKYSFPLAFEEILEDHKHRRDALIKALTTDFDEFYKRCDPDKKENLCLYAYGDQCGKWEVKIPVNGIPPSIPDPVSGINFDRNRMEKGEWLKLVADHCDSWLLALAFFLAARSNYDNSLKQRLFNEIHQLPAVSEVAQQYLKNNNTSGKVDRRNGSESKSEVASHFQILKTDTVEYKLPLNVDKIIEDHKGRRATLIKALTTDSDKLHEQCEPDKDNLSLYGHPDGKWEVKVPEGKLPPVIPEPVLGINFARAGMRKEDWLNIVACHSDIWLLAVATYLAGLSRCNKSHRKRLFNSINRLPTIFEIVSGKTPANNNTLGTRNKSKTKSESKSKVAASSSQNKLHRVMQPKGKEPMQPNEKETLATEDISKAASSSENKLHRVRQPKGNEPMQLKRKEPMQLNEKEASRTEDENTLCRVCRQYRKPGELWLCCDICKDVYHGKCVDVTPEMAESMKYHYKCQPCNKITTDLMIHLCSIK